MLALRKLLYKRLTGTLEVKRFALFTDLEYNIIVQGRLLI